MKVFEFPRELAFTAGADIQAGQMVYLNEAGAVVPIQPPEGSP